MTWHAGATILAIYLALVGAMLCLWPGLIRRQPEGRAKRLLYWVIGVNALLFYFLIFCDFSLLYMTPGHAVIDHARRWVARWTWAVLYGTVAVILWRHRWPRLLHNLAGALAIGSLLLVMGASDGQQEVRAVQPVLGNARSKIYHWAGCPNYPQGEIKAPWVALKNREEAEKQGYRAARNCREK